MLYIVTASEANRYKDSVGAAENFNFVISSVCLKMVMVFLYPLITERL